MPLNTEPGAGFVRGPEPTPANLEALSRTVSDAGADLGLACDPDADRLAVVAEDGDVIGEEYTLALSARAVLARTPGPVVANVSTSRMMDDVAAEFSVPIYRSPVGEINVVTKMREVSAVVGGEGNGGVILPTVHNGRDACTAAALVLTSVCDHGGSVSELVDALPSYSMLKTKMELSGMPEERMVAAMTEAFPDGDLDTTDGPKILWSDRWVHARMSGTEPVARIIGEAPDEDSCRALVETARQVLSTS
jgi:phosphomannomutase